MIMGDSLAIFLGAVVQPKTHQPVWVFRKHDTFRSAVIFVYEGGSPIKVGEGYLEGEKGEYTRCVTVTGYPRGHTPSGLQQRYQGGGFGTCLYTGLVLVASAIKDKVFQASRYGVMPGGGYGICSDEETRSDSANRWWRSALERGLTEQEEGEAEGGDDEDEEEEETEEDVDLRDNMNVRDTTKVEQAIQEAVSNYGDGYPVNIQIRGDLVRTIYRDTSSTKEIVADYYTLTSAEKHKLVAVRETANDAYGALDVQEASEKWQNSKLLDGAYAKDVILALNVSQENPFMVARLAACAQKAGATEDEVQALILRANLGLDLMKGSMGTTSLESMRFGGALSPGMGQVLHNNPSRRGKKPPPDFEPRDERAAMRRNPTTPAQERLLERETKALSARRAKLGWDSLEDLP